MKRIIITGATGLIGSKLSKKLIERGDEVVVFTRSPENAKRKISNAFDYVKWNYDFDGDWKEYVKAADSVIHLAGENVMGGRWTVEHKTKVMKSREVGTKNLVNAICKKDSRCKSFICASAIGYYNDDINLEVDETSQSGNTFLSDVTSKWEDEAKKVEHCGARRVSIRIGIALSKEGGALAKMLTPFKLFVGGPVGSGKQWMSWIHIDDIVNLFIYALDNEVKGVLNGVAPYPVTMNEFAKELAKSINRPAIFRVPEFILKIVFGEAADTIAKGAKVLPKRTLAIGFNYQFEKLEEALIDILPK